MLAPKPPRRKLDYFTMIAVTFTLLNIMFMGIAILRHPYMTSADWVELLLRTLFTITVTWVPWFWLRKRYGND